MTQETHDGLRSKEYPHRRGEQEAAPDDALRQMLTTLVHDVLDREFTQQLGAEPFERTARRTDWRNGYRTRQWVTRVGPLTLRIPRDRSGRFREVRLVVISIVLGAGALMIARHLRTLIPATLGRTVWTNSSCAGHQTRWPVLSRALTCFAQEMFPERGCIRLRRLAPP